MAERGFAGTGIAAISKASGLPASSIYWFFDSKDDLAAAVLERAMDRWVAMLEEVKGDAAPQKRLGAFMRRALAEIGDRLPLFLRLEMILALERGPHDAAIRERLQRGRDTGRDLLAQALAGAFEGIDDADRLAKELAPLAIAMAQGVMLGHELDPDGIDLDRFTEELAIGLRAIAEHRVGGKDP